MATLGADIASVPLLWGVRGHYQTLYVGHYLGGSAEGPCGTSSAFTPSPGLEHGAVRVVLGELRVEKREGILKGFRAPTKFVIV